MKLSIVIPVYNAEKYIGRCMDSIVGQIDENVEIILVDDGSTDNSLQICKTYESDNVIVIHKENGGVGTARNAGIRRCKGEWITFVDADDSVTDAFYKTFLKSVEESIDIVLFEYHSLIDGITIKEKSEDKKEDIVICCDDEEKELLIRCNFLSQERIVGNNASLRTVWGKFFRRSLLMDNELVFSEGVKIGQDMLFMLNAYCVCSKVKFVNVKMYNYYQNEESVTHRYKPDYESMVESYDCAIAPWLKRFPQYIQYFYNYRLNDIILFMKYVWFHKENTMVAKEKKKEVKRVMEEGEYLNYYKKARESGLLYEYSITKRMTFWMAVHNCYFGLKLISGLKYNVRWR